MTDTQPNILLITSDQQHWFTLGRDNPRIRTPNLDRLAAEGIQFDRAYCPNPVCSPSRSSIITGQYPSAHGCWTIGVKLAEDVPTVGDALQAEGYRTNLIGKAHFQPLRSAPEPNLARDPGNDSRPRLLARLQRPLVRLPAHRARPDARRRVPRRPALCPLDGGAGPRQLARLLHASAGRAGTPSAPGNLGDS